MLGVNSLNSFLNSSSEEHLTLRISTMTHKISKSKSHTHYITLLKWHVCVEATNLGTFPNADESSTENGNFGGAEASSNFLRLLLLLLLLVGLRGQQHGGLKPVVVAVVEAAALKRPTRLTLKRPLPL